METYIKTQLSTLHESAGTVWMPSHGWEIPAHYGDPAAEYDALKNNAVLFDLSHWTTLCVTGAERNDFIHGMLTNQVKELRPGMGNYQLFLTAKGKTIADCFLSDCDESLFLFGREANRQPLFEGLNKYLIMEDAEIVDETGQHALFSVQGPNAESILKQLESEIALPTEMYHFTETSLQGKSCRIYKSNHTLYGGFDIVLKLDDAESVWTLLCDHSCLPAGWDVLESARIEAGIPVLGKEMDDSIIPQEASLHHAINFEKGCYIGQETVARLHFRGHVNKELTGFVLDTNTVPDTELIVQHEGKDVGRITSMVKSFGLDQTIGLGYLRVALKKPENTFTATHGDELIDISVHDLPFVSY